MPDKKHKTLFVKFGLLPYKQRAHSQVTIINCHIFSMSMTLPESLDTRAKAKKIKTTAAPVADADVRAQAQEALATAAKTFSLKVLTVNIHKGFTFFNRKFILPELREAVRKIGAEVVFLQEVTGSHTQHGDKFDNYPDTPHYEFLADSIWPEFAYGQNAVYDKGDHGNAVMSKFPIVQFKNHDVSISGPERRGLLHCELKIPGRDLNLHAVCVHLSLREDHRTLQMSKLCDLIKKDVPPQAPLVVAGDFNDWRHRALTQLADGAGLHEVFVTANGQPARTFPARRPLLRLDRIYVRNAIGHKPSVLPRKPWSHLSDHAPLAAVIEL